MSTNDISWPRNQSNLLDNNLKKRISVFVKSDDIAVDWNIPVWRVILVIHVMTIPSQHLRVIFEYFLMVCSPLWIYTVTIAFLCVYSIAADSLNLFHCYYNYKYCVIFEEKYTEF